MWGDNGYCWVVLCKNNRFHRRENLFHKHRIPLAETDAYAPPPALTHDFTVRCDDCNKEFVYKPSEVLRSDQEFPLSFAPHPLFEMEIKTYEGEMIEEDASQLVGGAERRRSPRLLLEVGLVVRGESVEKMAFQEETFTISVSAHGALVLLSSRVSLGQTLFLRNSETNYEIEGRVTRFDQFYGGFAPVGIEFAHPTLMFSLVVSSPNSGKSKTR